MIRCAWFLTDLRVGGAERLPLILLPRMEQVAGTLVLMKDFVELTVPPGVEVTHLLSGQPRLRAAWPALAGPALRAAEAADVVVGGMEGAPVIVAALAARLRGRPLVAVVPTRLDRYREHIRLGALHWRMLRWALRSCRAVITASEDSRDAVLALGVRAERALVIPNPVSPWAEMLGDRSPTPGDPPRLITVARLEAIKGVDVALAAAARLKDVSFTWDVIGSGPDEQALRHRAGELELNGQVRFRGFVAELAPELGHADVFVLSSRVEGLPIAMLEAMAAGLAIVATRSGTGVEQALQSGAGILVPPDDPEALAAALRSLLAQPERIAALGAAARVRAREFGSNAIAARYAACLRAVAGHE